MDLGTLLLYAALAAGGYLLSRWNGGQQPAPGPTPTPGPGPVTPVPVPTPTPAPAPMPLPVGPAVQALLLALQAHATRTSTPIDDIALQLLMQLASRLPVEQAGPK